MKLTIQLNHRLLVLKKLCDVRGKALRSEFTNFGNSILNWEVVRENSSTS